MEVTVETIMEILGNYCCHGCDGYMCNLTPLTKEETAQKILDLLIDK